MHATQVLLKGEKKFKWLKEYNHAYRNTNEETILTSFILSEDGSGDILYFENLEGDFSFNGGKNFCEPVECYRLFYIKQNRIIEYRRNPHKLNLGVEEWVIVNSLPLLSLASNEFERKKNEFK